MSENTTPNFSADSEETSPTNTAPEPDTQTGESELTPEQTRKALEPLFRDLNQVLYDYGLKDIEITSFATTFTVQRRAYSRIRLVVGDEEARDPEQELVARILSVTAQDCKAQGLQLCCEQGRCYCSSSCP
jgi:hypothetical protein